MTYLFYFIISICLTLFQTTSLSDVLIFSMSYDFCIPFILYLALFRSRAEGIPTFFFLGFLMDSLSGGPFGLYSVTYFWLYVSVRWLMEFFHVGGIALTPVFIGLGVLIENIIFLGTIAAIDSDFIFSRHTVRLLTGQIVWSMCTGPFIIIFIRFFQKTLENWCDNLLNQRDGYWR